MRRVFLTVSALAIVLPAALPTQGQQPDFDIVLRRDGLANTFARLNAGQTARLVYLGGSVTQQTGWRDHVTAWFQAHYPGQVLETNAGWPGTGSAIGVLRLPYDVLPHDPDLVFIEFAINDETWDTIPFIRRNYDGMVRQIRQQNPHVDICFIETLADYLVPPYLEGRLPNTVDAHYQVADHYAIPSVNVGWALYEHVLAGAALTDFLPDGGHPNAVGHQIYADAILPLLEAERIAGAPSAPHPLPPPISDYPILGTVRQKLSDLPLPAGWIAESGLGHDSFIRSSQQGAEISVSFNGPIAAITFIKNTDGGEFGFSVDGAPFTRYPMTGGLYTWAVPVARSASFDPHTVRLRVFSDTGEVRLVHLDSATAGAPPTPTPTPSGTNLALQRPAFASSQYNPDFGPGKAVDGVITGNAKWTNNGDLPNWWYVDLGAPANLSQVVVYAAQAGGEEDYMNLKAYGVYATHNPSMDPASWTLIAEYDSGTAFGDAVVQHPVSGTYRYVGLFITHAGVDTYSRVPEIRVYGTLAAPTSTPTPMATSTPTHTATPTSTSTPTPGPTATPTRTTRPQWTAY